MVLPATITIQAKVNEHTFNDTTNEVTSAIVRHIIHPPDNIAGRPCILECKAFQFKHGKAPTVSALTSQDVIHLGCNWPQPLNRWHKNNSSQGTHSSPIASVFDYQHHSSGPTLCHVQEGPHEVMFEVKRADGGAIALDGNDNHLWAVLSLTPVSNQ